MLTEELNEETRIIIENTCEACRLDRGTSRLVLQDELDSLTHTFIKKRMIDDWSKGKLQDVFSNINMKIPQFRQKLLCYLKTQDISHQTKLANICDKRKPLFKNHYNTYNYDNDDDDNYTYASSVYTFETSLLHCCYLGDISFVKWCCDHGVDVNGCSSHDQAFENRYTCIEILKMFLHRGVDYNKCDRYCVSPVMTACENGHIEIVKMLLDRGADYNKCDKADSSPLIKACEHGHTEIVKMLLDRGADYNKYGRNGESPVMKACENGHTEIVKMLLDRGADYNKYGRNEEQTIIHVLEEVIHL
ncbi:putative ankyrin repeat protein RBE_0220 [Mytilus trossulus]|uniref:putative ankyrin repeat protein RBE_0220 n=1 Tax=Mytilus trossulus TaxID=6551 RepID=UPI003007E0E9